jgi:hypothetical protein
MITYKTTSTLLGGTTWRHLIAEIHEARLYNENYLYVTVHPTGAGFGYRVRFASKCEEGFVGIDEWLCGAS